jgi:hypothetical protein
MPDRKKPRESPAGNGVLAALPPTAREYLRLKAIQFGKGEFRTNLKCREVFQGALEAVVGHYLEEAGERGDIHPGLFVEVALEQLLIDESVRIYHSLSAGGQKRLAAWLASRGLPVPAR